MSYNSANRSERLLQNRRFTTDDLSLSQEAFTSVLDLNSSELYTQTQYVPYSGSILPFSGSSQDGLIVSASVVSPGISPNLPILKYHYRKKLKGAGDNNREVYYFTTSNPATPGGNVNSDQLIEADQQGNFISPKYIRSNDSSFNTEANPPGYKVVVYQSTSATAAGIIEAASSDANYVFDYKTGVLTWLTGYAPSASQYVYITVYQYVGESLNTRLTSISGSLATLTTAVNNSSTSQITNGGYSVSVLANGNINANGNLYVTGSVNATQGFSGSFSGSFFGDGSNLTGIASTLYVSASNGGVATVALQSQTLSILGTASEIETAGSGQTITIGLPDSVIINQNLTVGGNVTINGTTTVVNTTNTSVVDQFILLASGSSATGDGGIIVQNAATAGEAFYWENNPSGPGRWAIASNVSPTATSVSAAEYGVTANTGGSAPSADPTYGGATYGYGNIYVNSSNGDVYIYS
jgi:hypothetical protein